MKKSIGLALMCFFILSLILPVSVLAVNRDLPKNTIKNTLNALSEDQREIVENRIKELSPAEREAFIEKLVSENKETDLQHKSDQNSNNISVENKSLINKIPFFNNAKGTPWYKDWEAWGVILALLGGLAAVFGFVISKKKSKLTTRYFKEIDEVYSAYRLKGYRCEAELYRMKDMISEDFKGGKMDEGSFKLLEDRTEKYLSEIRESIVNQRFGGMPEHLKDEMIQMLESGEITEEEYKKFHTLIEKSTLSSEEKASLNTLVEDWKNKDKA